MVASGLLVVVIVKRVRPAVVISFALCFSMASYILTAVVGAGSTTLSIVIAFTLLGIGVGAAETLSNDLIIASVPPAKAGAASGVSETAYELGAVLGTAVLGSVLAAAYRGHLEVPEGVSAADEAAARETLAGAIDTAQGLPDDLGAQLISSAQHAFDSGVVTTSIVGASMMVIAVIVAITTLRKVES